MCCQNKATTKTIRSQPGSFLSLCVSVSATSYLTPRPFCAIDIAILRGASEQASKRTPLHYSWPSSARGASRPTLKLAGWPKPCSAQQSEARSADRSAETRTRPNGRTDGRRAGRIHLLAALACSPSTCPSGQPMWPFRSPLAVRLLAHIVATGRFESLASPFAYTLVGSSSLMVCLCMHAERSTTSVSLYHLEPRLCRQLNLGHLGHPKDFNTFASKRTKLKAKKRWTTILNARQLEHLLMKRIMELRGRVRGRRSQAIMSIVCPSDIRINLRQCKTIDCDAYSSQSIVSRRTQECARS